MSALEWEEGQHLVELSFECAEGYVEGLNKAKYLGFSDWRVPTSEELCRYLESNGTDLPIKCPDMEQGSSYWSSNFCIGTSNQACSVEYGRDYKGIRRRSSKSDMFYVRAVRGELEDRRDDSW